MTTAAVFLARRSVATTINNISRTAARSFDSGTRYSTAFQRDEVRNAAAESSNADTVKEGVGKSTEGVRERETVAEGETAVEQVVDQVVEEIKDIEGPVDMADYRTMEDANKLD